MTNINQEIAQAVHSLQSDHRFIKLTNFIEEQYEFNLKGLLMASSDKLQPLQGRTAALSEILSLFKYQK